MSTTQLATLTTTELIELHATLRSTTALILSRLGARLIELAAYRLAQTDLPVIAWEGIQTIKDDVLITGVRMFEVGDEVVDDDGDTITITEDEVDTMGQRVRFLLPIALLAMVEDPTVPIIELARTIDGYREGGALTDPDVESVEPEMLAPRTTQAPAPKMDAAAEKLFNEHLKSTTLH